MVNTVLYIEDNPNHARLVSKILRTKGYKVLVSNEGLQGVAMAARETPNLILLDMHLPDMTGEDVIARLRGDRSSVSEIPIMAVTASTDTDLLARVIAAGCDGYIQKPFSLKQLLGAVDEHFSAKSALLAKAGGLAMRQ